MTISPAPTLDDYRSLESICTQLRGTLSLAEEGLANYAQENAQLRSAMKSAERLFNALCFDMPDWVGRNEEVCGPFRVALNGEIRTRGAEPQSAPIDTVSGNVYSTVHGKDESGTAPGTAREAREDGSEAV